MYTDLCSVRRVRFFIAAIWVFLLASGFSSLMMELLDWEELVSLLTYDRKDSADESDFSSLDSTDLRIFGVSSD